MKIWYNAYSPFAFKEGEYCSNLANFEEKASKMILVDRIESQKRENHQF